MEEWIVQPLLMSAYWCIEGNHFSLIGFDDSSASSDLEVLDLVVLKSGYVGCAISRLDNKDVVSSNASVGSPVDECRVRVVPDLASRYVVGYLALVDGLILLTINGDGLLALGGWCCPSSCGWGGMLALACE